MRLIQIPGNRSAVIEAALRLWQAQQIEGQLRQFYQNCSEKAIQEETWVKATQDRALEQ